MDATDRLLEALCNLILSLFDGDLLWSAGGANDSRMWAQNSVYDQNQVLSRFSEEQFRWHYREFMVDLIAFLSGRSTIRINILGQITASSRRCTIVA